MRTTEQQAPEVIAQLIPKITQLTTEQPTTAELEEALLTTKALTRAVFEWLASRYSAQAAARQGYEAPAEQGGLDHVHPVFAPLLGGLRQGA